MNSSLPEEFGNIPNASEFFGTVPQPSEAFRIVRNVSERTEKHTLTVREVARLFEQSGVPRTERSIINWCRLNRQGVARLDAFFDEHEHRYYITVESVNRAIEEERVKQPASLGAEATVPAQKALEDAEPASRSGGDVTARSKELERQNRDLEIATRAKDFYIERLEKERGQYVQQLVGISRYVGELESQVLQLGGAPRGDRNLPRDGENFCGDLEAGNAL